MSFVPNELTLLADRQAKDIVYAHRQGACNDSLFNFRTCFDREHSDWGFGFLAKGYSSDPGSDGLGVPLYTSNVQLNKATVNDDHVLNSRYAYNFPRQFWPVRKRDLTFSAVGGVLPDPSKPYQTAKFRVRPLLRTVNFNPTMHEADAEVNGELDTSRDKPRQTGWWGYSDIGILTDHKRNPSIDNVIGIEIRRRGDAARYRSLHNLPCTGTNNSLVKCLPCERPSASDSAACEVLTSRRQIERIPDTWQVLRHNVVGQFLDGVPATPSTTVGEVFPCPMPDFVARVGEARIPFDVMRGRGPLPLDHPNQNHYTCEYKSGMLTHSVDPNTDLVGLDYEKWHTNLGKFVDYFLAGHVAPCCDPANCWYIPPNANPPFAQGMPQDFAALMVSGLHNVIRGVDCLCRSSLESMVSSIDKALNSARMKSNYAMLRTELRNLKSTLLTREGADDSECAQVRRDWEVARRPACIAEKQQWGRELGWTEFQVNNAIAADCGANCELFGFSPPTACALDSRYVRTTSHTPHVSGQPAGFRVHWVRDEQGARAVREGKKYRVARVKVMGTKGGTLCESFGRVGWWNGGSKIMDGIPSSQLGFRNMAGYYVSAEEKCEVGDGFMGQDAALCGSVVRDKMTNPATVSGPGRVMGSKCVLETSGRNVIGTTLDTTENRCFQQQQTAQGWVWEGSNVGDFSPWDPLAAQWSCFSNSGDLIEHTSDPRPRVFRCITLKHHVAMESEPGVFGNNINPGQWHLPNKYEEYKYTMWSPRERTSIWFHEVTDARHGCLEGPRRYTYDFNHFDGPKRSLGTWDAKRGVWSCGAGPGVCIEAEWQRLMRGDSWGQFSWKADWNPGPSNWQGDWDREEFKHIAKCPVTYQPIDCDVVVSEEYTRLREASRHLHYYNLTPADLTREKDAFAAKYGRQPQCRTMVPLQAAEQISQRQYCVPNRYAAPEIGNPYGRCLRCVSGTDLTVPVHNWVNSMEETDYTRTHRARVRGPTEPECWGAWSIGSGWRNAGIPLRVTATGSVGQDAAMCYAKYGQPEDPNQDPNFSAMPLQWVCENFVCKRAPFLDNPFV